MPLPRLITENDVRDAVRAGGHQIAVGPQTIITPLARDAARDNGLDFVISSQTRPEAREPGCGCNPGPPGTLAIASDHAGFEIKGELVELAKKLGWTVRDLGTDSSATVDYPDFAYAVARVVASGEVSLGVMIDGVGVGSAMVANKVRGVRAACCSVEFAAFNARAHNDANVLTLGSRSVGREANKRILEVFLSTAFEGGRHAARVAKIGDVENKMRAG